MGYTTTVPPIRISAAPQHLPAPASWAATSDDGPVHPLHGRCRSQDLPEIHLRWQRQLHRIHPPGPARPRPTEASPRLTAETSPNRRRSRPCGRRIEPRKGAGPPIGARSGWIGAIRGRRRRRGVGWRRRKGTSRACEPRRWVGVGEERERGGGEGAWRYI